MKKLFILILLLFSFSFISMQTYGATEQVSYSLNFNENGYYDLETGTFTSSDYWRYTNRVSIRENSIILNNDNYHHVLFYANTTYLGYYNSQYADIELSKYLGDSVTTITPPVNATHFALTSTHTLPNDIQITLLNNNSLNDVFRDGMTLHSEQLVTNGDFSNGTTGWTTETLWSISGGVANWAGGESNRHLLQTLSILNVKYYLSFVMGGNAGTFSLRNGGTTSDALISFSAWQLGFNSAIFQGIVGSQLGFRPSGASDSFTLDNIRLFNISTLIANKQYSPLFNTTFDLMSDAAIKTQMDYAIDYYGLDFPLIDFEISQNDLDQYYDTYIFNQTPYNDTISAIDFYSITAVYEREEVIPDTRNITEKLEDWFDEKLGIGAMALILIPLIVIGINVFVFGKLGASSTLLIMISLLWFVVFAVFGWFPIGLVITIAVLLAVLIYFNLKGGSSSD